MRGIGRSIAEHLAACGANVHVFDRATGDTTDAPFTSQAVDISDAEGVAGALAVLLGPPALLVNNAGIVRDRTIAKMTDEEWQEVLTVNLTGTFNMIRAVVPGMAGAGYEWIVNITSINGLRGKFGQANYTASKARLIGLTKTAARELGPKGITVNAVAPGMVMTEMVKMGPEEILSQAVTESALKQLAEPADITHAVAFLLSNTARMITG
jgi:acetoacetyl-CoA reductase/3-oxoacyl-[acyl-carrier protein] reductase